MSRGKQGGVGLLLRAHPGVRISAGLESMPFRDQAESPHGGLRGQERRVRQGGCGVCSAPVLVADRDSGPVLPDQLRVEVDVTVTSVVTCSLMTLVSRASD